MRMSSDNRTPIGGHKPATNIDGTIVLAIWGVLATFCLRIAVPLAAISTEIGTKATIPVFTTTALSIWISLPGTRLDAAMQWKEKSEDEEA